HTSFSRDWSSDVCSSDLPLRVDRLKTGTPPRIDGRSLDYGVMQVQHGDDPAPVFSYLGSAAAHPRQLPCHITHTNARTHDIIREIGRASCREREESPAAD